MDSSQVRRSRRRQTQKHTLGRRSRSRSAAVATARAGCVIIFLSGLVLSACTKEATPVPLDNAAAATGTLHVLDAPGDADGDTGWWPQVAFDARGVAHIAFCDAHHGDVRYAVETPSGWAVSSLFTAGAVGKYIAMDVDAQNRVGMAFYDQDKHVLRYAWQLTADGKFEDERVAFGQELGIGSALRFDAAGVPHLFYYLRTGKLIHAFKPADATEWTKEPVADIEGVYSMRNSAVMRPDGVYISYVDWKMRDAAMYLGHVGAQGWQTEQISQAHGPGWRSQLVFLNDSPVVVHTGQLTKETDLSQRTAQGNWQTQPLVAQGSSFAAATWHNKLVVAYQDMSDINSGAAVRYTRQAEPRWPVHTIDASGPAGGYIAAAVSPKGRLLVVFYADAERSLKVYDEQLTD